MSTTISKSGTSLQQTSTEELSKLSEKAGMVPSTPMGAKTIGANPDQAKMADTPATKAARTDASGKNTLSQEQRLSGPSAQGKDAPSKMERLKQLGSINMQVENLVEGYMQQMMQQQASLQLNSTALSAVEEGRRAGLEAALKEYQTATNAAGKESAVIKAGQAMGRPLTVAELQGYFQGAPEQLKGLAAASTPDSITLSNLDLQSAGLNAAQLAEDLGVSVDQVMGMSVSQLKQAIDDVQQREFSQGQALAAEAMNAVGGRAKQLQQERQALGQSGTLGFEEEFDQFVSSMDNADTVRVGGVDYKIDDLLKDERLSTIVGDAAINSAALKKLEETEPQLAAWVKQYQATLAELAKDAGGVAQGVQDTQAEAAKLKSGVSGDLFKSIFGTSPEIMSEAELKQLQDNAASNGLWQAVNADGSLKMRLESNPELAKDLQGKSKEEIDGIMAATKAAESNSALADLAGYTPGGVVSEEQKAIIDQWGDEFSKLPELITKDKSFQDLIKQGKISESGVELLIANPSLWDDVKAEQKAQQQVSGIKDEKSMIEFLTGDSTFTLQEFNDNISALRAWAATGDEKALSLYNTITQSLTGPDGVFSKEDMANALALLQKSGTDVESILKGQGGLAKAIANLKSASQKGLVYSDPKNGTKAAIIDYLKNDSKIDDAEFSQIVEKYGDDFAYRLIDEPWAKSVAGSPEALTKFRGVLDTRFNERIKKDVRGVIGSALQSIKSAPFMKGFGLTDGGLAFSGGIDTSLVTPAQASAVLSQLASTKQYLKEKWAEAKFGEGKQALSNAMNKIDMAIKSVEGADAINSLNKLLLEKGWGNLGKGFALKPLPSFSNPAELRNYLKALGANPDTSSAQIVKDVMNVLNGKRGDQVYQKAFNLLVDRT